MNQITDGPNPTPDFGYGFNYAVWPKDTVVDLVNVPWNNDYRDIVKFNDRAALDTYIDSRAASGIRITKMSYLKPNQPIAIDVPFNVALKYNYLRARNPIQPISGDESRNYYYFVTNVEYVAPNTTRVTLQLDVWQTFGFDATFGNCYIERGHIGIANTKAFDNYGRDNLTIPEGIDIGSEYQVVTKANKSIVARDLPGQTDYYNVLVVSTTDLQADPGTISAPKLKSAQGGRFAGMPSGASQYLWPNAESFAAWLATMQDASWITAGIVSITIIPPITRYGIISWAAGNKPTPVPSYHWLPRVYSMWANWRNSSELNNYIPARYRGLKKLFTFPYMVIELTTFTGTPIMIKPEAWNDANATVVERINPVPPNQRVAISPYHYNSIPGAGADAEEVGVPTGGSPVGDDNGDYLDLATLITNFPTLAIVNNGAVAYLAANANSIAFQHQSADWSQQRALQSNQVSYDQASAGMNLANTLTGIGNNRDATSTSIGNDLTTQKAILGSVMGAAGGAASGGAVGAVGGLASGAAGNIGAIMDINANNQQLGNRINSANAANNASVGTQGYVRDTNKNLADFAARGDYENTIAGINAKVRDAQLIQPTTAGQVGGDAMNFVNNNVIVSARFKMIDQAAIRVVGEYWLRYGYAVRKFAKLPASLMVMTKFTYWKLSETYITGANMPESMKQILRGMLEKGVTVWADPDDIGNIDIADNAPLGGITL
jgi:hypothetical protein